MLDKLNLHHKEFLPELFDMVTDDVEMGTKEVADLLHKSDTTIGRWCRIGKLNFQQKDPYIIKGSDIKQMLFEIRKKPILGKLQVLSLSDDPKIQKLILSLEADLKDR